MSDESRDEEPPDDEHHVREMKPRFKNKRKVYMNFFKARANKLTSDFEECLVSGWNFDVVDWCVDNCSPAAYHKHRKAGKYAPLTDKEVQDVRHAYYLNSTGHFNVIVVW